MRKNELLTGADSRPRIHIFQWMGGHSFKMGIGHRSALEGAVFSTAGAALDAALDSHSIEQAVIILGAVPGAPGEG